MKDMLDADEMVEATRLTRAGRLVEATTLLQRMLGAEHPRHAFNIVRGGLEPPVVDAMAESERTGRPPTSPFGIDHPPGMFRNLSTSSLVGRLSSGLAHALVQPPAASTPGIVPDGGQFIEATYSNRAGTRAYKLYIPGGYRGQAVPLVVMLHGCTQSPDDFAAGTRMNMLAEEHTCLVVYPEQSAEANPAKCWNWFRPSDQRRDEGEPSLIAGITRQVMRDYSVDRRRVYVAGLSAGAAAAAVVGTSYPDVYAAIGVHSGLACGAAHNIPSAFAAMRQGKVSASSRFCDKSAVFADGSAIPTIVFHGDQDKTVHPRNGNNFIGQVSTSKLEKKKHTGQVPGGHKYTRTIYADASGRAILEHWDIHGGGHAWSGGSPAGSYTDPRGPDAAREMLRFFLEHPSPAKL